MSLIVHDDLDQGSPEWLQARCGVLTASVVGKLLTMSGKVAHNESSRGLTETLVAERLTGRVEPMHVTADMERGTLDEPFARDHYAQHHAPVTEVGFMVRELDGRRLGYSPDGLVGTDGLIEIKSRRPKVQLRTILTDTVPAENMAQIQTGLLVSGRAWCDYVSWCGGMPAYVKRVLPDLAYFALIEEAAAKFEDAAEAMAATYRERTDGLPATEHIDHYAEMEMT